MMGYCSYLCLLLVMRFTSAHVRLTYPRARQYELDALNSRAVPGKCGMPRDSSRAVNIEASSSFLVTWNVGSPHEGGIRIELLDKNYNLLHTLTPVGSNNSDEFFGDNPVITDHGVTLPENFECSECVLRLAKLGRTPTPGVPLVFFSSCADINVVSSGNPDCSQHGKWNGNHCECDSLFSGDLCQYPEECGDDMDCSSNGECIATNAQSFPKKQCYCSAGWFGPRCNMESPIKSTDFDAEIYQNITAPDANLTLYWRILDESEEIEFAVRAPVTNWVAIGWRPAGLNATCKLFPKIEPETFESVDADGKVLINTVDFFDVSTGYISGPFHPMSCNDIVFVAARNKLSRIRDMYTRDVSTPREDSVYDGNQDLTAAIAEEDPVTGTVTFLVRKKLLASEPADHSITAEPMHVIWAVGEQPFDKAGTLPTEKSAKRDKFTNAERIKRFYRKGELNSHAHNLKSRGFWQLNFM